MTKYFAMIDGERRGPYELQELMGAGVHPSTYVWCKGMEDWEMAETVPDICRYFRQYLSGTIPASEANADDVSKGESPDSSADPLEGMPIRFRKIIQDSGIDPEEFKVLLPDYTKRPYIPMATSIASAILCFPPTGFVAIYHCYKATKIWRQAEQCQDAKEQKDLRVSSHDEARQGKMWLGITLSLALILYAFLLFKS